MKWSLQAVVAASRCRSRRLRRPPVVIIAIVAPPGSCRCRRCRKRRQRHRHRPCRWRRQSHFGSSPKPFWPEVRPFWPERGGGKDGKTDPRQKKKGEPLPQGRQNHLGITRLQSHAQLLPGIPDDLSALTRLGTVAPRPNEGHGLLAWPPPRFEGEWHKLAS